ncbi:MmgE/PrpD family protein [Streptomyces prunicolor]|uniref:MmgE/PrpD family protein n=1 Tax=Streptomyces prunicolor TaxID=67348 RepID=A0ABU4F238_9ACTN|nr:MmgE/PrpD family protein [Streptomyces prunicolor]MDV7214668.1 MmgE/PrpD family protein [Streptomyces prunicolor]
MSENTLATRLAAWVAALEYDQLPPRAVEMAKLLILDQLGLQVRGATLPNVRPELRLVEAMRAAPESTMVLSGTRTVAPYAAFANGTLGAAFEFDDVHMYAAHIGSAVVPTALAFGESTSTHGREVLTAVVAGAQVMSLLGATTVRDMVRVGWHGSKILGTFGAAATAGRLLGLTPGRLTDALGIAGSDAGGTMEYERSGGEVKRMHSGSAARSGAQAALLAQDGLTGPVTIIEGERGLFRLFAGTRDTSGVDGLWDHFHIVDTIFRLYPTIGSAGPAIEAVAHLLARDHLPWREIKEIRLGLPAIAVGHGAAVTRPTDMVSAQFSTAFSVALRLVRGHNRPEDYMDPALWTDPDLLSVVDKVVPYSMEFPPDAPFLSCRVDIALADGRVLSHTQWGVRGHPAHPDTEDTDIETKFLDNVDGIISRPAARKIIERIKGLESLADVAELMNLTGRREQ